MTETFIFWVKVSGAAIGSSIAIVFKPGEDTWLKLCQRFVIGTVFGFIVAPIVIDKLGWQHTFDYWLASATIGGVFGYLILQFIFSTEVHDIIKKRFSK